MVVPSPTKSCKKTKTMRIPTIDLSMERIELSKIVVKACEEYGFFKVVNHGVPKEVISRMEEEGAKFFGKPSKEKREAQASAASPFGYGFTNIGPNGDMGDLEYLLLHAHPLSISQRSKTIANDSTKFSCVVNDYIEAVKEVTCEIVDLIVEGLGVPDKLALSRLIRDVDSDSVLRINHYPSMNLKLKEKKNNIGFGAHSDPQILTIMRSNDVGGLQIYTRDGSWIPVPPDPTQFFVMVGDILQVLTNGKFMSVRHRALTNTMEARMSMMYFAAPPLDWWITPLPNMVSPPQSPSLFKPFTWAQYKQAAYSLRLGDSRLPLFKAHLLSASPSQIQC
ncbi:Gibberellin 2-beta-dioxygenase 2, partial [Mucuna pruriens]